MSKRTLAMRRDLIRALIFCASLCLVAGIASPATADEELYQGFTAEQRKNRVQRLEAELAKKDLAPFLRMLHENKLVRMRSIAMLQLGVNGELIVLPPSAPPSDEALYVVPENGNGLTLMSTEKLPRTTYEIPPSVNPEKRFTSLEPFRKKTYATVSPTGEYTVAVDAVPKHATTEAAPVSWPFRDETGRLTVPAPGTVIAASTVSGKSKVKVPKDTLGWLFVTADGLLNTPLKGMEPFENVIWVSRRSDCGLELVHAGPLRKGLYAAISPDCVVETLALEANEIESEGPKYWPFADAEDGTPLMVPEGSCCRPWVTGDHVFKVRDDGTWITPAGCRLLK